MSNNGVRPKKTGGSHWLEYLPGYAYCFLPSFEAFKGDPYVYHYVPEFLNNFLSYIEIEEVWKWINDLYSNMNLICR